MPYPNQHAARLKSPTAFKDQPDWAAKGQKFARKSDGTIFGKVKVPATIAILWGQLPSQSGKAATAQSLRFPTSDWTEAAARKWLADNNVKTILFEAATGPKSQSTEGNGFVRLSQPEALVRDGFKLDRDKGIMRNVAVITAGVALGHDFEIDQKMLRQVRDAIKAHAPLGVKSRLTHPRAGLFSSTDGIEYVVGRAGRDGARLHGDQVVADIQFGKYAKSSPKGDLWTYLFDLAEDDPGIAGLSIVFVPDQYEEREDRDGRITLPPLGRVKDVLAVDFVGDPGANPGGLPGS